MASRNLNSASSKSTGTVLLPTGDQRFLAGEVHGDELRLSRFDGGSAYLYHARMDQRGRLVGEFWSGNTGHRRFVAVRNDDAELDTAPVATGLRDPAAKLQFVFPGLDGKPVALSDPQFAGKVVLVALAGKLVSRIATTKRDCWSTCRSVTDPGDSRWSR